MKRKQQEMVKVNNTSVHRREFTVHSVFRKSQRDKGIDAKKNAETHNSPPTSQNTVNCSHFYNGSECVKWCVKWCELFSERICELSVNCWGRKKKISASVHTCSQPVHGQFTARKSYVTFSNHNHKEPIMSDLHMHSVHSVNCGGGMA